MLSAFGPSTVVAVILGVVLAAVAFIPVVAYRYRKTGVFRFVDLVVLLLVATYAIALWSYTLVPIPESNDFVCSGQQFVPFQFIVDIRADGGISLHNRALLQAVFNVFLFMPLGFFVRVLLKKGAVAATLLGFVVSALIETTQLTGVWGMFHCAYRVFDIDDLILNTSGALVGSLLAWPVVRLLMSHRPAPKSSRITFGRRALGMFADVFIVVAVGVFAAITWRAFALYVLEWPLEQLPEIVDQSLISIPPLLLEGYWVLRHGRTLGEAVVQLQPVSGSGNPLLRRLIKLLFGVGGYILLSSALNSIGILVTIFGLVSLIMAAVTRDHRGLSHMVAGMELQIGDEVPDSMGVRTGG